MSHRNDKELDTAGEIISQGEKFAEKYAKLITLCVLGIIILAFGIWAYIQYVSKPREVKAAGDLFPSEQKFVEGADSTVLKAEGVSEDGVLRIIDEYGSTDAGNLSHAYAGIAYYDLGKYAEALEELKKFSASETMVAPSIVRLMGDCCVELDKLEDAVDYFKKAASMANNTTVSPSCLIKAARVYEELKKYDKAIDAYQEVVDEYYNSPELAQAKADIARVKLLK